MSAHPAQLLDSVKDDAARATILIQKLTSSKDEMKESLPRGTDSMPPVELHFCSGLAFTFVKKGGIGVSVESGHGFVIRKILEPPPPTQAEGERASQRPSWTWSAPLFISVLAGGLGLTFGYSEIESVMVLDTPEAVQAFTRGQTTLDTDITGAAGSSMATHLPATAANLSNLKLSDKTFAFSVVKGAMVDVSLTGLRYNVDERTNQAFYGAASPQAILDGAVEAPQPFRELCDALDKVLDQYYSDLQQATAAAQGGGELEQAEADAGRGAGGAAPGGVRQAQQEQAAGAAAEP